jgi:hypothetical protein
MMVSKFGGPLIPGRIETLLAVELTRRMLPLKESRAGQQPPSRYGNEGMN